MADQGAHDVVIQTQSVGDRSLADVHTSTTNQLPATLVKGGDRPSHLASEITSTVEHVAPAQESVASDGSAALVNGTASDGSSVTPSDKSRVDDANSQLSGSGEIVRQATPTVNGDRLYQSDAEDSNVQLASADASGGSDNEAGRRGSSPAPGLAESGVRGHLRSNSVKKPASFKAVSVTKSFLAKAATGSAQPSKPGTDKSSGVAPGGQASAANPSAPPRPRLVAKSGGGRDNGLRSSLSSNGSNRNSAPDPSQVWNKNRPVQPPPPKQFTDEELKQQYGIHLATRLQADETSKEAKWADIDDDDDDWAPETIEWNDGTKITLGTPDEPAGLVQAKVAANAPKDERPAAEKPKSPSPVAKPAANNLQPSSTKSPVTTNGQTKPVGLVLKGAPEKPTLVAKPPAPAPVKSPWAPLPPVEKLPPVTIKPQQAQLPERFQRDPHGFDSMPPAPSPAKEIAADDFNRTWRDNQSGTNRELYNSQSGRYEPVGENRRNSIRAEPGYRQPAVLQRPSQADSRGPAEPSAAFQTSRSSGQDMGWGRRRGSSNVSGGSGAQARHLSMGRGPDVHFFPGEIPPRARQGSQQTMLSDKATAPASPVPSIVDQASQLDRCRSPLVSEARQAVASRPPMAVEVAADGVAQAPPVNEPHHQTSSQAVPDPEQPGPSPGQLPVEDAIAMQKKIMRESRELAMKRRKEQEEKEEAERKERIRKKMEDLGLPPPEKKNEQTNPAAASAASAPVAPAANAAPVNEAKITQPVLEKETPQPTQSPPMPPPPESSEEVKQYGVMKVHPVSLRKKASGWRNVIKHHLTGPSVADESGLPMTATDNTHSEPERPLTNGVMEPNAGAANHGQQHLASTEVVSPPEQQDQPGSKNNIHTEAPRHRIQNGTIEKRPHQSSPLWGPPNSDGPPDTGSSRTEHASLFATSEPQPLQAPKLAPGPIGPPSAAQQAADRMKLRTAVHMDAGHFVGAPPSGRIGTGIVPAADIGTSTAQAMPSEADRQQRARAAWKSLPAQLEANDAATARRAIRDRDARAADQAAVGSQPRAPAMPAFTDKWRQIIVDDAATKSQRKVVGVSEAVIGGDELNAAELNADIAQRLPGPGPAPVSGGVTSSVHGGRESRFFPHITTSTAAVEPRTPQDSVVEGLEAAGPPPESSDHPAYDGNSKRPNVSLPAPKPIVKLPPAAVRTPPSTATSSPQKSVVALGSSPRSSSELSSWQDRIDSLFGRKTGWSSKSHTPTVSSSSKAPLEVPSVRASATVSLPARGGVTTGDAASTPPEEPEDIQSRAMDDFLFEEREFGSLPVLKFPPRSRLDGWQPAKASANQPKQRPRFQRAVQTTTRDAYVFKDTQSPQGSVIEVRLPGASKTTSCLFKGRSGGSMRQRNPSINSGHGRGGSRRGGHKSRESSGAFGPSRPTPPSGPAASTAAPPPPTPQGPASRVQAPPTAALSQGPVMAGPPAPMTWASRVSGTV